ncbi:MAG: DUF3798 domain-containing protein [Firmicutes bacterium]|nr:DUF3798 domain-containing protein [Bacillota bacterium]
MSIKPWLKSTLISVLIIGLLVTPACSKAPQNWKLGIITLTDLEDDTGYQSAKALEAEFGQERIWLASTRIDRWISNLDHIDETIAGMADDPDVKAIIIATAVSGVAEAVTKAREARPDILFILGTPLENPDIITAISDIVMDIDFVGRGHQIVEQAVAMGTEVFVHYSFPRHMEI